MATKKKTTKKPIAIPQPPTLIQKRRAAKKKLGQPTKCTPTVQKAVTDALRMGAYVETAVAHAGITKEAHYSWMKRAAKEKARRVAHEELLATEEEEDALRQRPVQKRVLTQRESREHTHIDTLLHEQVYVDYADAVQKALAAGEIGALGVVAKAAAGGAVISRTTRTDANGAVHVTEKIARPEWTSAAWMLERRHPRRYGRLVRTEVSGPESGPVAMTWVDAVKQAVDQGDNPDDDFEGA